MDVAHDYQMVCPPDTMLLTDVLFPQEVTSQHISPNQHLPVFTWWISQLLRVSDKCLRQMFLDFADIILFQPHGSPESALGMSSALFLSLSLEASSPREGKRKGRRKERRKKGGEKEGKKGEWTASLKALYKYCHRWGLPQPLPILPLSPGTELVYSLSHGKACSMQTGCLQQSLTVRF